MYTAENLISTSVSDARTSLGYALQEDPWRAGNLALTLLARLHDAEGHAQRRQLAARVLRRAARTLAADPVQDPRGPLAGDPWAEMSTGELRLHLDAMVRQHPGKAGKELLRTLVSLRGEPMCDTRRKLLVAGVGKVAKQLSEEPAA